MPARQDSSFLELLEPVHDRLYRYALAVMGDAEDAKDLVSDTILAAYEQFDRLREPSRFFHLLLTIASRKSKRRIFRARRFSRLDDHLIETLESSHLTVEQAADIAILLDLLQRLPTKLRETFVLFEVSDLSLVEIQAIQGGSLSGVKSRLARARLKVKALVTDVGQGSGAQPPAIDTRFEIVSHNLVIAEPYGH
jgi:RNA polymerase sigma-70 factor (ECF subfamily)